MGTLLAPMCLIKFAATWLLKYEQGYVNRD